jgi:hypothetical protein
VESLLRHVLPSDAGEGAAPLPYYSLLTTNYRLLTAHCLLTAAYCLLPTAYCLLPTAHCPLPTAYCLLPTAYCLLPTGAGSAPPRNSDGASPDRPTSAEEVVSSR